jgi:hypothetical protein
VTIVARFPERLLPERQLHVERPQYTYRFLFSDGRTLDVLADNDDSDVREAVRVYAEADRIAGVAKIEP